MISVVDNLKIEMILKMEEIKTTVFELSGSSVTRTNGFTGLFFSIVGR